ncbi:MAG: hypothetical protein ABI671_20500 [Burkholderiales bacterium]
MRWPVFIKALGVLLALTACEACCAANEFSGQVRPSWTEQGANPNSPLAQAAQLNPDIAALPRSGATLETELRASGHGLSGTVTLQQQRFEGTPARSKAWVNELYAATGSGGWQFSAGKRIVAWDVGYGFRPNDVVQQETRRSLLSTTAEGRPLLMAEYFDASTAWSFVAVNPTKPHAQRGAEEPAFAARVYQRDGAIDWHGFARYGAHTGGSIGAAAAWVATDALELHASLRYLNAADSSAIVPATTGLVRSNPWSDTSVRHAAQLLVGGTWTNAAQVSVLAEAWWDGTALSDAQWNDWNARNAQLAALVGSPAPSRAVAGNLAWQATAFGASSNLRRTNLFMRVSVTLDKWQPALDLLYTPADAGRTLTASLGWQGDRVRVDAGLRVYGGPADAVLAQLPARRVAYVAGSWAF